MAGEHGAPGRPPGRPLFTADWWIGIGLIIVIVLVRSHARGAITDLDNHESLYLFEGRSFSWSSPPSPEWGPLYALWYALESRLVPDPTALFSFNWSLLFLLNLTVLWSLLCLAGLPTVPALCSIAVLGQLQLFESSPYVGLFASALAGAGLIAGLLLTRKTGSVARGLAAMAWGLACGAFARPELGVPYLLCIAVVATLALKERRPGREAVLLTAGTLLPGAILYATFGNPLGSRSLRAFQDHFAMNLGFAQGDNSLWTKFDTVYRSYFGTADSLGAAARANPRMFLWHIGQNALQWPLQALQLGSPAMAAGHVASLTLCWISLGALCAGLLWSVRRAPAGAAEPPETALLKVVATILILPAVASSLLVFPHARYLQPLAPALVALAAVGWSQRLSGPRWAFLSAQGGWRGILAAVVLLALMPGTALAKPWWVPTPTVPAPLPGIALVRFVKQLPVKQDRKLLVLEWELQYGEYAGWNATSLNGLDCFPFAVCLAKKSPDVVVLTGGLLGYYGYMGDGDFEAFAAAPERYGFRAFDAGSGRVLVRTARLSEVRR